MSIKREGQYQLSLNQPSFPGEHVASVLAWLPTDDGCSWEADMLLHRTTYQLHLDHRKSRFLEYQALSLAVELWSDAAGSAWSGG